LVEGGQRLSHLNSEFLLLCESNKCIGSEHQEMTDAIIKAAADLAEKIGHVRVCLLKDRFVKFQ